MQSIKSHHTFISKKSQLSCWVFPEDVLAKKLDQQQENAMQDLNEFIERRKREEREEAQRGHARVMKLVGPEWFQELSPTQLTAVDELKSCILLDIRYKHLINTKDAIEILGVRPLPKTKHFRIALERCCKCPVEFLLILYQLINGKRTKYSLNDRLLLSGVVHLTLRQTLKELHIRMPSPPPPLIKDRIQKIRKKRPQPRSPYLKKFNFKRTNQRKYTGIYKNNERQYPISPYFSYIPELKPSPSQVSLRKRMAAKVQSKEIPKLSDVEKEISEELEVAQIMYDNLAGYEQTTRLLRPSVYTPCIYKPEAEEDRDNLKIKVKVTVTTDYDSDSVPIRKSCDCTISYDKLTDAEFKAQNQNDCGNCSPVSLEVENCSCTSPGSSNRSQSPCSENQSSPRCCSPITNSSCPPTPPTPPSCRGSPPNSPPTCDRPPPTCHQPATPPTCPITCEQPDEYVPDDCGPSCRGRRYTKPKEVQIQRQEEPDEEKRKPDPDRVTEADCKCLKEYNYYDRKHATCMQAYFDYMQMVKGEVADYMAEVEEDARLQRLKKIEEKPLDEPPRPYTETVKDDAPCPPAKKSSSTSHSDPEQIPACDCQSAVAADNKNNARSCAADEDVHQTVYSERTDCNCAQCCNCMDDVEEETTLNLTLEINKTDCTCAGENSTKLTALTRMVILDRFPQDKTQQQELLKVHPILESQTAHNIP